MLFIVEAEVQIPTLHQEVHDGRPYLVATSADGLMTFQEALDLLDTPEEVWGMMVRFRDFVLRNTRITRLGSPAG